MPSDDLEALRYLLDTGRDMLMFPLDKRVNTLSFTLDGETRGRRVPLDKWYPVRKDSYYRILIVDGQVLIRDVDGEGRLTDPCETENGDTV